MRFHSLDAERQSKADVLGRLAFRDELQNLALARCQQLKQLEVLFLHGCGLDDGDALALLASPYLRSLRCLALSANAIGPRVVDALAESELCSGLDELDICQNPFPVEEAEARLRASPFLARLRRLCV